MEEVQMENGKYVARKQVDSERITVADVIAEFGTQANTV
jgi:hypothetical protein